MHPMSISPELLEAAILAVEQVYRRRLPFRTRGIYISRDLVAATMEILNEAPEKTLAQHSANAILEKTKDGLDRRLKERFGNLRRANITISDVLARAGIVDLVRLRSQYSVRKINGTRLRPEWTW